MGYISIRLDREYCGLWERLAKQSIEESILFDCLPTYKDVISSFQRVHCL